MYLRSWNMFITSIDHVYQVGQSGNTAAVPNYDSDKFVTIPPTPPSPHHRFLPFSTTSEIVSLLAVESSLEGDILSGAVRVG